MIANKLIQNSRSLLCKNTLQAKHCGVPVRNHLVLGVPARNNLSTAERIMFAGVLMAAMWGGPMWILYHIPEYQNEDRSKYTGK